MKGNSKPKRSFREEAGGASLWRITAEPDLEFLYEKYSVLSALMINEVSRRFCG